MYAVIWRHGILLLQAAGAKGREETLSEERGGGGRQCGRQRRAIQPMDTADGMWGGHQLQVDLASSCLDAGLFDAVSLAAVRHLKFCHVVPTRAFDARRPSDSCF